MLGHPASLTRSPPPLSHRGGTQRGTISLPPALDSFTPRTAEVQNRRELFRDLLIDLRSKISKCFGSPHIREAIHISSHHGGIAQFVPQRFVAEPPTSEVLTLSHDNGSTQTSRSRSLPRTCSRPVMALFEGVSPIDPALVPIELTDRANSG